MSWWGSHEVKYFFSSKKGGDFVVVDPAVTKTMTIHDQVQLQQDQLKQLRAVSWLSVEPEGMNMKLIRELYGAETLLWKKTPC